MDITKQVLVENLLESLRWLANVVYLLLTLVIAGWLANAAGTVFGGRYLGAAVGFVVFGGAFLGMMMVYYQLFLDE